MKNLSLTIIIILLSQTNSKAQEIEDLMNEEPVKEYVSATFKSTRAINMHTVETTGKRTLEFRINHRFGTVNSGAYNLWGLDGGANIQLSLGYSYEGRLEASVARTSQDKEYSGYLKYKILQQTKDNKMPFTLTLFTSIFYTTLKDPYYDGVPYYPYATSRMSFAHQVIMARKFNDRISFQLAPVMVHFNQVDELTDKNDVFVLTGTGRFKISRSTALTLEYGWRINNYTSTEYYDTFGIGFDIETGGHVFQMVFTNSFGLTEPHFLTQTSDSWSNGGIRFGFNISRVFTL